MMSTAWVQFFIRALLTPSSSPLQAGTWMWPWGVNYNHTDKGNILGNTKSFKVKENLSAWTNHTHSGPPAYL